ncbi:MAG: CPBP family intramembrane metalloprotease [Anaerolineales bacterium]|nr:CPBP family intramembrane metalloprotease [Anaerolineales bacterium]
MEKGISFTENEVFHSGITRLIRKDWATVTLILLFHIVLIFIERMAAFVSIWLCILLLVQKQGRRVIGLRTPGHWVWWLIAPVLGLVTVGVTALILWALLGWTERNMFYDMAHAVGETFNLFGNHAAPWLRFTALIFAWIVSPFLEEPLFRGFAQTIYGQRFGVGFAVIFQAMLFALVHPLNNVSWFVSIFVAGIGYGIITKFSKSVWVAVLAHITYNFGIIWIAFTFMPEFVR